MFNVGDRVRVLESAPGISSPGQVGKTGTIQRRNYNRTFSVVFDSPFRDPYGLTWTSLYYYPGQLALEVPEDFNLEFQI